MRKNCRLIKHENTNSIAIQSSAKRKAIDRCGTVSQLKLKHIYNFIAFIILLNQFYISSDSISQSILCTSSAERVVRPIKQLSARKKQKCDLRKEKLQEKSIQTIGGELMYSQI